MTRWISPIDRLPRPCAGVFLDQDGALTRSESDDPDPSHIEFVPHALDAVRRFADNGYAVVLVANRPSLADGGFPGDAYRQRLRLLSRRLYDEAGVTLAGSFTCGHALGSDGRPACLCRRPAPGLLKQAALTLRLELSRSWIVGCNLDDVEAGRRAGCKTALLDAGNDTLWRGSPLREPHLHCRDLLEAAQAITSLRLAVAANL